MVVVFCLFVCWCCGKEKWICLWEEIGGDMCHVARKKQNPRHRHCEPYVQRTYIVYTVPMWFLRLFGVSVGSAQAHGLIHRTCPNSRLQDSLALTGTYVRTNLRLKSKISRTCDLFQLESSRVSLGKFPGLTHSYGILSRKIASPGKVERTPHSQWSTEENKTTRKQKNTTNNNNNNDDDDREGSKTR